MKEKTMLKKILLLSLAALATTATACAGPTTDDATLGDEAEVNGGASYALTADGACTHCGTVLPGRFAAFERGFGRRRIPVRVAMGQGAR